MPASVDGKAITKPTPKKGVKATQKRSKTPKRSAPTSTPPSTSMLATTLQNLMRQREVPLPGYERLATQRGFFNDPNTGQVAYSNGRGGLDFSIDQDKLHAWNRFITPEGTASRSEMAIGGAQGMVPQARRFTASPIPQQIVDPYGDFRSTGPMHNAIGGLAQNWPSAPEDFNERGPMHQAIGWAFQ